MRRPFRARLKRRDQRTVVAARHFFAGFDRGDHLANAVDDREHAADQSAVGVAASGTDVGQGVLSGMAERLEPRKFEEAAIPFHRVHKAKDAVEPGAIAGLGFPGDDFAAQRFEHFAAFGYEIGNQVVHRRIRPSALASAGLMQRRS